MQALRLPPHLPWELSSGPSRSTRSWEASKDVRYSADLVSPGHCFSFALEICRLYCFDRWPTLSFTGAGINDPESFQFEATGVKSAILTAALERYRALCISGASSVLGHYSAPVNTNQLLGLDVNVTSDELALGLTTSENYTLRVAYPRASLVARTVYGALRGLETFSQLLQDNLTITAQTIVDWPRFPFRAVRWEGLDHSVLLWMCC